MTHPVMITVVHHPEDQVAAKVANDFVEQFDRLGTRRAGTNVRVPVRLRSEPFHPSGSLRPIEPQADVCDVILVLLGSDIDAQPEPWQKLLADAELNFAASPEKLVPLIVTMDAGLFDLGVFSRSQQVRWHEWRGMETPERSVRLLIHTINAIRRKLGKLPSGQREPIFVSHAKSDGKSIAERIVGHIDDPANGLRLHTFYDGLELESGEDWTEGIKQAATTGSVLALVSNAYDARPWCNQEILWAKEHRRPILLVDIGRTRVDRSFPYSGNVPFVRDQMESQASIECALLELLSEALRCDLFLIIVAGFGDKNIIALPRPPELADLAFWGDRPIEHTIVYPDPALSNAETDLLQKMSAGRRICVLSDL